MIFTPFRQILPYPPFKTIKLNTDCWVRSPAWDLFWLHSGVWLGLLFFTFSHQPALEMFYIAGVFLFWIAHRFSSFYLAWGTRAYRNVCANQPWRFVFFPLILGISVIVVLLMPETVLPVSVPLRILGLLLLDFIWGMHHFAAQHYGMLRLFHHRSNPETATSSNRQDRFFCWGAGFLLVLIAELLHGTSFLQEKQILPLLSMDWGNEVIPLILRLGTLLVLAITMIMIRNAWLNKSGLPRILYILGVGIMVTGAFQFEPFQFLMLWTLQHWMAALGLATHMGGNDISQYTTAEKSLLKITSSVKFRNPWIVLLLLCTLSVILTPFFEIEAASAGTRYSEIFFPSLMELLENSNWFILLVGIGIATGFLHYLMDRAVYRFSDFETRLSARKLLYG
ncbi:MAG: hypothetical protein MAG581_02559 [Deltaproteobacteria bacterium]|jgi:hypothetical protein|nr:hypothetical protein [Deltaproteobacteria bacterium]